jgi:hypothetical protein
MPKASTASCPNVGDDGRRPSSGQDGPTGATDLPDGTSEIFLILGLDMISDNQKLFAPTGKSAEALRKEFGRQLGKAADRYCPYCPLLGDPEL